MPVRTVCCEPCSARCCQMCVCKIYPPPPPLLPISALLPRRRHRTHPVLLAGAQLLRQGGGRQRGRRRVEEGSDGVPSPGGADKVRGVPSELAGLVHAAVRSSHGCLRRAAHQVTGVSLFMSWPLSVVTPLSRDGVHHLRSGYFSRSTQQHSGGPMRVVCDMMHPLCLCVCFVSCFFLSCVSSTVAV